MRRLRGRIVGLIKKHCEALGHSELGSDAGKRVHEKQIYYFWNFDKKETIRMMVEHVDNGFSKFYASASNKTFNKFLSKFAPDKERKKSIFSVIFNKGE